MKFLDFCNVRKNRIIIVVLILLAIILGGAYIIIMDKVFHSGFKCPFHYKLGFDCPGCGGSRMILSILELNLYQAFRYNPFMFITLPFVFIIFLYEAYEFIEYNRLYKHLDKIMIIYVLCMILFGIVRNISFFDYMLPTVII